ncbi:MAG TPA: L,D-transpeptidase family protein [Polyangiaceae bacterium]|nr:L,D-transpeptidase family protein [Polyangiaceae bacterium]
MVAWRLLRIVVGSALISGAVHAETTSATQPSAAPITSDNKQLLLVHSPSWFASSGTLEQYERSAGGRWTLVRAAIAVDLGRHGMAWGRGLQQPPEHGPFKKEGDGKSPAGVFALGRAFGTAEAPPEGARAFPYLQSAASTYCVEDVRSEFYNEIIDARYVTSPSWEKWSELRRPDGLFDWGVIVRQNAPDVRRGAGSCVFLHIWRGRNVPTSGCTAMAKENIEAILRWLDSDAHPLLVQLPDPELAKWRTPWDLPE